MEKGAEVEAAEGAAPERVQRRRGTSRRWIRGGASQGTLRAERPTAWSEGDQSGGDEQAAGRSSIRARPQESGRSDRARNERRKRGSERGGQRPGWATDGSAARWSRVGRLSEIEPEVNLPRKPKQPTVGRTYRRTGGQGCGGGRAGWPEADLSAAEPERRSIRWR